MLRYLVTGIATSVLAAGAALAAPQHDTAQLSCPAYTQHSQGLPTNGEWRTYPSIADVNGDGFVDIVATPRKARGPRVWLGSKNRRWRESSQGLSLPGETSCGVGTRFGDLNGDGAVDLAVADHCHGLFVFLGDGKGRWRPGPQGQVNQSDVGVEDVALGDMDGDGDLDLVTGAAIDGGIEVLLNDGKGFFETAKNTKLPEAGWAKSIELGDINEDGVLDIAASYTGTVGDRNSPVEFNMIWLASLEEGQPTYQMSRTNLPVYRQARMLSLADVNADGHLDLAASFIPFREGERLVRVFEGDGLGGWTEASENLPVFQMETPVQYAGVTLADLNGDGFDDLASIGTNNAKIYTWMSDGRGHWKPCGEAETGLAAGPEGLRSWGIRAADTNADGKLDLVASYGRVGKGAIEVWLAR